MTGNRARSKEDLPHVLLIEEDAQQFELYSQMIQEVGSCKIDILSQRTDLLSWLDRLNYHLVVMSETRDSLVLLEKLKRISPTTSVILLSSNATVEEAVSAMRLGAEDYLAKPFQVDAFQLAVKRSLDRKMVFGADQGASHFLHLLNSCQLISSAQNQKKIFDIIQSFFVHELRAGYCSIYSFEKEVLTQLDRAELNDHQDRMLGDILDISVRASHVVSGILSSQETYRFIEPGQLTPSLFVFKFDWSDQKKFFCACLSPTRPLDIESFENSLRMLRAQIEVTARNIEEYLGVQQLVYVDDVTGLYNTRYLSYILEREITHSQKTEKSFAILFIDADRFKSVNDTHGHSVGTQLLNELGNHLKKYVREKDTIFRYGGDEFVAVLSPCDLPTAKEVAERIRESVEKMEFLKKQNLSIHFTVSIGVALFPVHAKTLKDIIEAADHAMYVAKNLTRNSVSIAAEPGEENSRVN